MNLINLTPHPIMIETENGSLHLLSPQSPPCRVSTESSIVGAIQMDYGEVINLYRTSFGDLENLPDPQKGTRYILSYIAARAAAALGRTDVLIPGAPIRNQNGEIVACRGLDIITPDQ